MKLVETLNQAYLEQIKEYRYYTDMIHPGFHEFIADIEDDQVILTCDMNDGKVKDVFILKYDSEGADSEIEENVSNKVIAEFKKNFNEKLDELYDKAYNSIDEEEERLIALEERADDLRDLRAIRSWFSAQ